MPLTSDELQRLTEDDEELEPGDWIYLETPRTYGSLGLDAFECEVLRWALRIAPEADLNSAEHDALLNLRRLLEPVPEA